MELELEQLTPFTPVKDYEEVSDGLATKKINWKWGSFREENSIPSCFIHKKIAILCLLSSHL